MVPGVQIADFIQYGAFGVLAFLVFWFTYRVIPRAFDQHEKVVTRITDQHEKVVCQLVDAGKAETAECRAERLSLAVSSAAEREKDRIARESERESHARVVGQLNDTLVRLGRSFDSLTPDPDAPERATKR